MSAAGLKRHHGMRRNEDDYIPGEEEEGFVPLSGSLGVEGDGDEERPQKEPRKGKQGPKGKGRGWPSTRKGKGQKGNTPTAAGQEGKGRRGETLTALGQEDKKGGDGDEGNTMKRGPLPDRVVNEEEREGAVGNGKKIKTSNSKISSPSKKTMSFGKR